MGNDLLFFLSYFNDNIDMVGLYKEGDKWIEMPYEWNYGNVQKLHQWPISENFMVCLCCVNNSFSILQKNSEQYYVKFDPKEFFEYFQPCLLL